MALLSIDAFSNVFEPLRGKRIGFVQPIGNVGDELIIWATQQMLCSFGIDWQMIQPDVQPDVDELVFGSGGNMGTLYQNNWELRGQILRYGIPVTIFPQTFNSREDRPYHRVYVRERESLKYCEQGILAPDLALGLNYQTRTKPRHKLGVFLRKDPERRSKMRWFKRDPAKMCQRPTEYLELAAQYERIITDRLHFAISGLIVGRDVTLLPNSYHKNRSMHETWLTALGCRFAETLKEAKSLYKSTKDRQQLGYRKTYRANRESATTH
ncbi:MAG: polysaccharide pyruvyl transferase family protein [Planctomycetia bacterium]|jgi:exopolysaccharide biosynthesis predicted pyruvyltransferase EpsI